MQPVPTEPSPGKGGNAQTSEGFAAADAKPNKDSGLSVPSEDGDAAQALIARIDEKSAGKAIGELRLELNRMQRSIRMTIQTRLSGLQGRSCETLEANQALATALHELLDGQGLRVQCSECGHPAILRVSPRRGSPRGAFVFDHSIGGRRTFHGGAGVVPTLRLIAKPLRKKK